MEIPYSYKEEEEAAADLKKTFEAYVDKYANAILEDSIIYLDINTKEKAVAFVSGNELEDGLINNRGLQWYGADDSDKYKNCYVGSIEFDGVPLYVDKEVDAGIVKNDGHFCLRFGNLSVEDGDLKFSDINKVSAKIKLETTVQYEVTETDMATRANDPVYIVKELYANVKTSGKAGGKADVFLKGLSVNDEVEGEIPIAVAIGQNNLTGAITMRNYVDNHGDEKVRYGHYKNDDYYYVDSAQ